MHSSQHDPNLPNNEFYDGQLPPNEMRTHTRFPKPGKFADSGSKRPGSVKARKGHSQK
jgi:hypothetical protein